MVHDLAVEKIVYQFRNSIEANLTELVYDEPLFTMSIGMRPINPRLLA